MNNEKIIEALKSWGWNEGDFEEIVAHLAIDGHIEHASADISDDRKSISYDLELTPEGIEAYEAWRQKHGYSSALRGNVLTFDDEDESSVEQTLLEWGVFVEVSRLDILENIPNDGEAYAIVTDGSRFAFVWGAEYPYQDVLPAEDIPTGESGLEWHETEEEAREAMRAAMEAWGN